MSANYTDGKSGSMNQSFYEQMDQQMQELDSLFEIHMLTREQVEQEAIKQLKAEGNKLLALVNDRLRQHALDLVEGKSIPIIFDQGTSARLIDLVKCNLEVDMDVRRSNERVLSVSFPQEINDQWMIQWGNNNKLNGECKFMT